MRIDGKEIASRVLEDLKEKTKALQKKNITPHLVIILIGNDPASESYVRQKELKGTNIGAQVTIIKLPFDIKQREFLSIVKEWNSRNDVNGIIVQRPLPNHIDPAAVNPIVDAKKDIDAFRKDSPYAMPLAAAVIKLLEHVYMLEAAQPLHSSKAEVVHKQFSDWLKTQCIVVIGKGETGGGPTITLLKNMGVEPKVIDSKTPNPQDLTKNANIIISTVGKENLVMKEHLKKGVILIGVGMYRGEDGKLHGDYNENDIKDIASFYTPIPGGVGPVNVAMLLKNLVEASIS